eukprot:1185436-Prorocentrum_minimum.AAC.1
MNANTAQLPCRWCEPQPPYDVVTHYAIMRKGAIPPQAYVRGYEGYLVTQLYTIHTSWRVDRGPGGATKVFLHHSLSLHFVTLRYTSLHPGVTLRYWRVDRGPGGATKVFLHHSLSVLDADLRLRRGAHGGIVFRSGPCLQTLACRPLPAGINLPRDETKI